MSLPWSEAERVVDEAQILPHPKLADRSFGGVRSAALRVVLGLSRDGDGLDRLIQGVGIGVNSKPIALALRSSTLNILAFILASYSSIDWVTYSWPYLSIL
jgi:hypothetical protein